MECWRLQLSLHAIQNRFYRAARSLLMWHKEKKRIYIIKVIHLFYYYIFIFFFFFIQRIKCNYTHEYIKNWKDCYTHCSFAKSITNDSKVRGGYPALCNQALVCHIKVQHVECVVNGLDLAHLDEPCAQVLCCSSQDTAPVVCGLTQNLPWKNSF